MLDNYQAMIYIFLFALILYFFIRGLVRRRRDEFWYIDRMTGLEFEEYLEELFKAKEYEVTRTAASCDYGADLILQKEGQVLLIQAKCYAKNVGLEAVQQVAAAVPYYEGDFGFVVTNQYYTEAAKKLALPNQVRLVDRDGLKELIYTEAQLEDVCIEQTKEV